MSAEEPSTRVTLRDVFNVVTDVRERVIRVEGQVGTLIEGQEDHEGRIRALERRVWIASGIAMAGGAGLGEIARLLGSALSG